MGKNLDIRYIKMTFKIKHSQSFNLSAHYISIKLNNSIPVPGVFPKFLFHSIYIKHKEKNHRSLFTTQFNSRYVHKVKLCQASVTRQHHFSNDK